LFAAIYGTFLLTLHILQLRKEIATTKLLTDLNVKLYTHFMEMTMPSSHGHA